jgi:hypothetical protein
VLLVDGSSGCCLPAFSALPPSSIIHGPWIFLCRPNRRGLILLFYPTITYNSPPRPFIEGPARVESSTVRSFLLPTNVSLHQDGHLHIPHALKTLGGQPTSSYLRPHFFSVLRISRSAGLDCEHTYGICLRLLSAMMAPVKLLLC